MIYLPSAITSMTVFSGSESWCSRVSSCNKIEKNQSINDCNN